MERRATRIAGRLLAPVVSTVGLGAMLAATQLRFGGEDPLAPAGDFDNWHHRGIANQAAVDSGWSAGAASEMSWHADFVDSYLYNPLWWVQGGLSRIKTALSLAPALTNVHFDDLSSVAQVTTMWRRYLSGAITGVLHAATLPTEAEQVAAARHVVGVALHATADFYSHSNWVDDPARRRVTWSDHSPHEQARLALFTGTYEHDEHTGIAHHGKYSLGCTLMEPIAGTMDIVCHAASPFSNTGICQTWRSCSDSVPVGSFEVLGVPIPGGFVHLDPPGINLDSTWLARIGAQVRGFSADDGPALFAAAKALAVRECAAMLATIGATVERAGHGDFWAKVRTNPAAAQSVWHDQYEDFHRQGLHFVGTGTYPPAPSTPVAEWFLRLRIVTADTFGAGTDADIFARTPYGEVLLDTMAGRNPLIAYNDFEAGDDQVFHVGPFPDFPSELRLRNDSAGVGEVFLALGQAFVAALSGAVELVEDFFLSIIGGHADHVATTRRVWTPSQLAAIGSTATSFTVRLDGGGEGIYDVQGTIRRTRRSVAMGRPVSSYEVHLVRLRCIKESDWDRGSNSDEPFLFAMLVNQASRTMTREQFGPYSDVDTGESRTLDRRLTATDVPDGIGYVTLPLQVMESDDEGSGRRRDAFNAFSKAFMDETEEAREGFISALGRSMGADWEVASLQVHAYRTGVDEVAFGQVLAPVRPGVIAGDTSRTFALDRGGVRNVPIVRPGVAGVAGPTAGQPGRRTDLDGSGASDVLVSSPWGLGYLSLTSSGMTAPAMAANGTRFDGWLLNTHDNRFGPIADVNGDGRDEVVVTSPWGLGILGANGTGFRGVMLSANGTRFGGWLLNTADNRVGPVADVNGDGRDEVVVTSPWGLGILRFTGSTLEPVMMAPNGTRFGGWLLGTDVNVLGPVGDFDGDGREEVVISSGWGMAILRWDGSNLVPIMMAANGTRFGGWLLNTGDNRFGPVGDLNGDGRDELVISSPWGMGILRFTGSTLEPVMMAPNGTRFGGWLLNTADNHLRAAARFGRGQDDLFVTSPWGIGVLGLSGGSLTSQAMTANGTRIDGWIIDTNANQFVQFNPLGGDGSADVLLTSGWGLGVLRPRGSTFRVPFLAGNGTRFGGWLLNTADNTFG